MRALLPSPAALLRRARRLRLRAPLHAAAALCGTSATPPSSLHAVLAGSDLNRAVHALFAAHVVPGDRVCDATAGNGHDAEALAALVGPTGHLLAIDAQPAAVEATRARLEAAGLLPRCTLVAACHSTLCSLAEPSSLSLVCFNLGYLPGSDKQVVTQPASTVAALAAAACCLQPGGLLTALCYVGHPGGLAEAEAVEAWAAGLHPSAWHASITRLLNRRGAPRLLVAYSKPEPGWQPAPAHGDGT